MAFKSILKGAVFSGVGLLVLALIVLPHALPFFMEQAIHRLFMAQPGLEAVSVSVDHLGLTRAVLGPIRVRHHQVVDSVTTTYTPAGLLNGHPDRLLISGVDVHAALDDDGLTLMDGIPLIAGGAAQAGDPGESLRPAEIMKVVFAHAPSRATITHGRLRLDVKGLPLYIPFNLSVDVARRKGILSFFFTLFVQGLPVHGSVTMDRTGAVGAFQLSARDIVYERWNELIHLFASDITLKGQGTLQATGTGKGPWRMTLSRVAFDTPGSPVIDNLDITLVPDPRGEERKPGMPLFPFHARMDFQAGAYGIPAVDFKALLERTHTGRWRFSLAVPPKKKSSGAPRHFISLGTGEAGWHPDLRFNLDMAGGAAAGTVSFAAGGHDFVHRAGGVVSRISRAGVDGRGTFDFNEGGKGLDLHVDALFTALSGRGSEFEATFPRVGLPLDVQWRPGGRPTVSGRVSTGKGTLSLTAAQPARLSAVALDLPFVYPFSPTTVRGTASAENIFVAGHRAGRLRSEIFHSAGGIKVAGQVDLSLLQEPEDRENHVGHNHETAQRGAVPHLAFQVTTAPLDRAMEHVEVNVDMPAFRFTDAVLRGTGMLPRDLEPPRFGVTLGGRARIVRRGADNITGSGRLDIVDGEVFMADNAFAASGIETSISFDELPRLRSRPGMLLTLDRLQLNKVVATDAKLRYTLESGGALLLENSSIKWCQGEVTTGATRFTAGTRAYHVDLLCHQLRFADLLQQVGAFQARGEGSLNGRIPVSWVDGNISFSNGYLYSTPGVGGTIRVTNTERFTAGIPVGTPQFGQVDLAREALKNYTYEWARVGFDSQGESLQVKMEFDGRPENVLPFEYRREIGGFVRVDASRAGSKFQGIKLDVNLKLPFNRVLRLGNRFNRLFEK